MRIEIRHSSISTGMISKTVHFQIDIGTTFSDEELSIIEDAELDGFTILTRSAPSNHKDFEWNQENPAFDVTIGTLRNGGFSHVVDRKRLAHDFVEHALSEFSKVRELLDRYADLNLEDRTVEI